MNEAIGRHRVPPIRRRSRLRAGGLAALLAWLLAGWNIPAIAADVEQVQWGFDGQLVPHRFNLLSVLFSNNSAQPFDGTLQLRKSLAGQYVDAPLIEAVYLAPHSSRWVQFHPYSKLDWEEWILSWGPNGAGQTTLPKPRQGGPACVLLEEADTLAAGGGGAIKRFPENLFPVQLTATDALKSVVIDHVPRWEEGRARGFLDWIRHGGHVHLLRTPQGEYPQFTGLLEALNLESSRKRLGDGLIERHDRYRRQLDALYVQKVLVEGVDPAEVAAAVAAGTLAPDGTTKKRPDDPVAEPLYLSYQWEGDEPLFTALKKMSRPNHRWILIHLMSLTYIGLLFPGCYALGKRFEGDYRKVFGALLGIVTLFSVAFLLVGRRGYGEQTSVHSIAVAQAAGPDRYDVSQWSNAFVTDGGDYTLAHNGSGRIYSTCQDEEVVRGEIRTGAEAQFTVDMPPFSSRAFGHRTLVNLPTLSGKIAAFETTVAQRNESVTLRDLSVSALPIKAERIIQKLVIEKGENFPAEYQQVFAVFGRRTYALTEESGRLEMKSEIGSLTTFLQIQQQNDQKTRYLEPWSDLEGTSDQLFRALYQPLVARALNVANARAALDFALPEDRVRLMVYAPMPPELFVQSERFRAQQGYVLYCLDLFPSEP